MNKTEAEYAELLRSQQVAGEIIDFKFEPLRLIMAKKTSYTPDFLVVNNRGEIEIHEVKGFWRDDARVKIKTCARLFPWFRFIAVTKPRKNGGWKYEEFLP